MNHDLIQIAWKLYRQEPPAVRLHVIGRVLTCPFAALIRHFPGEGAVLDIGCGRGLLLNFLAQDSAFAGLHLYGIDHDKAKIDSALHTGVGRVDFSTRDIESFADASFDVISIIDVLYAVRRSEWGTLLNHCFRLLRPRGRLLLKEVVDRPRWKYWAIMAQEALSVRVFGITRGDRPHFESPDGYRQAIVAAGFSVIEDRPLPTAAWISHYLFVGRKI